ncbi:divalent-cation tolerance protein CutA [Thalassotalea loyana]|uniref:Divalent-cation tolerance protein CutA n=1 Tax=Thalassotalea loyana TaxID=280483 RepID=A0ABQ6H926_9GAMM|nr:divalent-cation tolerance protein CutA [Thalassotalea loyana]GLX84142.1 divalent-cation tolerance protein CutA [Thalassotalea loyana]
MYQIVLCTCPTQEVAKEIAHNVVNKKLAACVNIIPQMTSVYLWQGEVHQDNEQQLIIKTLTNKVDELTQAIERLHPYDVPEIIAVNIDAGNHAYLNWITESLK